MSNQANVPRALHRVRARNEATAPSFWSHRRSVALVQRDVFASAVSHVDLDRFSQ